MRTKPTETASAPETRTLAFTPSEIITLKAALSNAADALIEQAGWCGDNASEKQLREEAQEYYEIYNKLESEVQ